MTAALEVRCVSKTYGEGAALVHALRDVDLVVEAGGLVAIMGPSGSGKSTLLTIAGTLGLPPKARVTVLGHQTSRYRQRQGMSAPRRSIGYVFRISTCWRDSLLPRTCRCHWSSMALAARLRVIAMAALDGAGHGRSGRPVPG
jgi:ABC-type multidrug transport system ATPase subunit